jgi:hypothetical protein
VAGGGLAKGTVPRQNAETLLQSQGCKMPAGCIETLSASLSRQLTVDFDYVWFVPSGAVKDDLRRAADRPADCHPGRRGTHRHSDPRRCDAHRGNTNPAQRHS